MLILVLRIADPALHVSGCLILFIYSGWTITYCHCYLLFFVEMEAVGTASEAKLGVFLSWTQIQAGADFPFKV